jgi:hypothetical protein
MLLQLPSSSCNNFEKGLCSYFWFFSCTQFYARLLWSKSTVIKAMKGWIVLILTSKWIISTF